MLRMEANPIIVKELRERMRGGRAFVLLTAFLLGLAAVAYGLYLLATRNEQHGATILSSQIGQTLFAGLSFTLLGLICIVAPAVTAGTISGERERLTYEMLIATPLRPWRLLWGKLVSALSYVLLLLLAAVPLGSIVYIFGGITLRDVLKVTAIVVMTAIFAGTLGIFASTLLRRTARAAALSYIIIGVLTVGLLFSAGIWQARKGDPIPRGLLAPNPISAVASSVAIYGSAQTNFGIMPVRGMLMDAAWGGGGGYFFGTGQLDLPGWSILSIGVYETQQGPNGEMTSEVKPIWRDTLVVEWLATLALFWLSLHLVRPRRRWRPGREDLVMLAVVGLSVVGAALWRGWV